MESPVLLYHKIDRPTPDIKIKGAFTAPKRFERQITYLKRNGFSFLTASEMAGHYRERGHFPERAICLTFDDGWKDNYTNAFPILKKLGIPATLFLVPSCIGKVSAKVSADGESAREHMSSEDIREMRLSGFEIGSHGMDHLLLDRASEAEIESEIAGSKRWIENTFQSECRVFAYPAGFYTAFARDAVKRAGYMAGFSTTYGSDTSPDIFALNRTEILRRHGYPFRFARQIRRIYSGQ